MSKITAGLFGLCIAASFSAKASLITVDSIKLDSQLNTNDLSTFWDNASQDPSAIISTESITEATLLYSGSANNNTFFKLTAEFASSSYETVSFFAGLDAGYGAEIFFNNDMISNVDSDIWWQRNFTKAIELIDLELTAGLNTIEVFWAENGNSGGNSFELNFDQNQRMALAASNLPSAAIATIPEPSSFALFAIALAGLGFARKKQH